MFWDNIEYSEVKIQKDIIFPKTKIFYVADESMVWDTLEAFSLFFFYCSCVMSPGPKPNKSFKYTLRSLPELQMEGDIGLEVQIYIQKYWNHFKSA